MSACSDASVVLQLTDLGALRQRFDKSVLLDSSDYNMVAQRREEMLELERENPAGASARLAALIEEASEEASETRPSDAVYASLKATSVKAEVPTYTHEILRASVEGEKDSIWHKCVLSGTQQTPPSL